MKVISVAAVSAAMIGSAHAEIVEFELTGAWTAADFDVSSTGPTEFATGVPQENDDLVFGVAPSDGSTTVRLRVDTSSVIHFAKGEFGVQHDWYGYSVVQIVGGSHTFGSASWTSADILTYLEGPNGTEAALWTDAPLEMQEPRRASFRMFGSWEGYSADMFFGSRTSTTIGNRFLLWEFFGGEEIRSAPYIVNLPGAPTADAGPDIASRELGAPVTLDGSGSFDDDTPSGDLAYAWTLAAAPAGSAAALSGADTSAPSLSPDVAGEYVVELVVTDATGLKSAPDTAIISTENLAPTADAGRDSVVVIGDLVILDGTGSSDPEGAPLDFSWSLSGPTGSAAFLAGDETATPDFVPDLAGSYIATLTVSDDVGPGAPDSAEIVALEPGDYAGVVVADASDVVEGLPADAVDSIGEQRAFTAFLASAARAVQQGDFEKAIENLEKALARTDGCPLRGAPDGAGDGRDWILDCAAQEEIYLLLTAAIDAID